MPGVAIDVVTKIEVLPANSTIQFRPDDTMKAQSIRMSVPSEGGFQLKFRVMFGDLEIVAWVVRVVEGNSEGAEPGVYYISKCLHIEIGSQVCILESLVNISSLQFGWNFFVERKLMETSREIIPPDSHAQFYGILYNFYGEEIREIKVKTVNSFTEAELFAYLLDFTEITLPEDFVGEKFTETLIASMPDAILNSRCSENNLQILDYARGNREVITELIQNVAGIYKIGDGDQAWMAVKDVNGENHPIEKMYIV
jgi:hypothetical protein